MAIVCGSMFGGDEKSLGFMTRHYMIFHTTNKSFLCHQWLISQIILDRSNHNGKFLSVRGGTVLSIGLKHLSTPT